jgi:hypothetical protein
MPEKNGLADLVGKHYRLELEESWYHELPEIRIPDRIYYERIPCQGGAFIGLYSLDPPTLKLYTPRPKNARGIFQAIKHIPGVKADFHFDGEAELYFPPEAIHVVAPLAGARKKRRLSPEHRAKAAAQGTANFMAYRKTKAQAPKTTPILNDLW